MPRIIYLLQTGGDHNTGGHKMVVRHVETLRELGSDAFCACSKIDNAPTWFEHSLSFESPWPLNDDDIVVTADDVPHVLRNLASTKARVVVFAQNPYWFAAAGFEGLAAFTPERFPTILTVSEPFAATIRRAYPAADVRIVRCFADERLFKPAPAKRPIIAYAPRKRVIEAAAIRALFQKIHPHHADLEWKPLIDVSEREVAATMAEAAVFLSLNRLESVGITTLEAMASGCVCAGFTGVGGWNYARTDNGYWVADEDCEAAADAVAAAADLWKAGGEPLEAMLEAGHAAAREWSYARFRQDLGEVWSGILAES